MMRKEEFQSLVLSHRVLLTRTARGLTRNPEDAEDLVQETLLCAFNSFGSYAQRGCVTAWLRAILRNRFLNAYRKKTNGPQAVSLEAITDPVLRDDIAYGSARGASTASPEQSVLDRMEAAAVLRALAALAPEFRDVVVLADVDGLTYKEIAERLTLPVSTVRTRLHRGRMRIRRTLFAWRAAGCP
jgi:RNA polymerase sigma-70 factor (ECF subfamily)